MTTLETCANLENKKHHGGEFERFPTILEYKAAEHGIRVDRVFERNTNKTSVWGGRTRDANRVKRG